MILLSIIYLLTITASIVLSLDNGLARTPPMGFLSWERFRCYTDCVNDPDNCISETLYKTIGEAMVSKGFIDAGYDHINIDDCWQDRTRDAQGRLQPDPTRFPSGIKSLANFMHERKLKLGIYSALNDKTCGGFPGTGTLQDVQIDAQTIADWGIDMFKLDGCNSNTTFYKVGYPEMTKALNKTGRPILYSCSWPAYIDRATFNWTLVTSNCNIWRLYDDIGDSWDSMMGIANYWAQQQDVLAPLAKPGQFNDPDMLIIGDYSLTVNEAQVQMSLWSIFAAPLLVSSDLRVIGDEYLAVLLNKEVIAIDQDPLGIQGKRFWSGGYDDSAWYKPLKGGDVAVALVNGLGAGGPWPIAYNFSDVGVDDSKNYTLRDLWAGKDLGVFTKKFSAYVPPRSVLLLRMSEKS